MSNREKPNLTPEEQTLQKAIRGLDEVQPNEASRDRLRREFMSGAIDSETQQVISIPARKSPWHWLRLAAVPAFAAILIFVLLGGGDPTWTLRAVEGTGAIQVNGQSVDAGDIDGLRDLVVPGAQIVVPSTAELELVLGKVMVLAIIKDSDVIIPGDIEASDGIYKATVTSGELLVKTGPAFPGESLWVFTAEGRVELTGTTIAVNKMPDVTCVCVSGGTALIGVDTEDLEEVPSGMRKVMFGDGRPSMIVPIEPGHQEDLKAFEARNQDTFK